MYKDKDRQRQANRQAKARQRAKQGMTSEGMTNEGMTGNMTIETLIKMDAGCGDKLTHGVTKAELSKAIDFMATAAGEVERLELMATDDESLRQPSPLKDVESFTTDRAVIISDQEFTKLLAKADPAVCRPVSKPGDADYVPMCEVETDAY